jgi:hypothetical protein
VLPRHRVSATRLVSHLNSVVTDSLLIAVFGANLYLLTAYIAAYKSRVSEKHPEFMTTPESRAVYLQPLFPLVS